MIPVACLLGLLYGLGRHGRVQAIFAKNIDWMPLVVLSFLCEWTVTSGMLRKFTVLVEGSELTARLAGNAEWLLVPATWQIALAILQFSLAAIFLIRNLWKPGLLAVLIGTILNATVVIANAGRMPVGWLAARFGPASLDRISAACQYLLASGREPLLFLGDWIPFWSLGWYMVSLGDFFISFGMFMFAAWLTRPSQNLRRKAVEAPEDFVYTKIQ